MREGEWWRERKREREKERKREREKERKRERWNRKDEIKKICVKLCWNVTERKKMMWHIQSEERKQIEWEGRQ